MNINEAEIQVLSSIYKAENDDSLTDLASIEARGGCYSNFKEDWSSAFDSLMAKGLIVGDDRGYLLTDGGRPLGQKYRNERPDLYWYYYQKFYPAAHASPTHSRLCERVFGEDLCQEGQTDMDSLNHLLELLDLKNEESMLDLGCGAGVISEYISDQTGAQVTGIDYAAPAIAEATERTSDKRSRLNFIHGDFSNLGLEPNSYDAMIAIDTLYWDDVLEKTLSMLTVALRPGGRMGIFLNHHINEGESLELLNAEHSNLSQVLSSLGLAVETFNYTKELGAFWHRLHMTTTDLWDDFEAEGNGFIPANYIREAEEDHLPEIAAGTIARHLYIVRC
jgi:ubiquinone/menaquinone biosynthesis C-methylase UbiE